MYFRNAVAFSMIWSLMPHVEHPPNKIFQKKLYLICDEKLLQKGPSILNEDTMLLFHLNFMWGYMLP